MDGRTDNGFKGVRFLYSIYQTCLEKCTSCNGLLSDRKKNLFNSCICKLLTKKHTKFINVKYINWNLCICKYLFSALEVIFY